MIAGLCYEANALWLAVDSCVFIQSGPKTGSFYFVKFIALCVMTYEGILYVEMLSLYQE